MKSLKSTKLFVLIISAALLVAGIVGITASADDSAPSLEIFSKNLSYGGTISIAFAVDAQNIGDSDAELLIYMSEPTEDSVADYTVTSYEKGTVHGREALIFLAPGIAAKDMTKQIYVKAHAVVDGADVYSETERYSVAEYAYDMQYRSKINENFIKLGAALLEVGEQIQTLLSYNTDSSPADFFYVCAEGGTVDGKYSAGLFKEGESVTLSYNGEIPAGKVAIWKSESASVMNGNTVKACAHSVYEIMFEDAYIPGVYYNDASKDGTRHDDASTVTGPAHTFGLGNNSIGTFESGTTYIVETDFTFNSGKPVHSSDYGAAFFGLQTNDTPHNSNMLARDYIKYLDGAGSAVSYLGAEFVKGVTYNLRFEYTVGDGNYPTGSSTADYAARTEYLKTGFKFFVNGVEIPTESITKLDMGTNAFASTGSDKSFWGLGIQTRSSAYNSSDFSVTFDNTFISPKPEVTEVKLDKSYYDGADVDGTKLDFEEADDLNGIFAEQTHSDNKNNYGSATIVDGALNVANNPAWYGLLFKNEAFDSEKTYAAGTKYIFEADITYNGGASVHSSDKGAAFIGFITKDHGTDIRNGDMATYVYAKYENSDANLDLYGADFKKGETHKLTIVYTVGTPTVCEVYLDLVKIADARLTRTDGVADTNCVGFGFYFRGTGYTNQLDLTFDNVFVGVIEAE